MMDIFLQEGKLVCLNSRPEFFIILEDDRGVDHRLELFSKCLMIRTVEMKSMRSS